MERENSQHSETYSGFKVVSRKNKKKKKQRNTQFSSHKELKSETQLPQALESGGESNLDENESDLECNDVTKSESTPGVHFISLFETNNDLGEHRVSTDAMLKAPPSPSIGLEEETSSDDKNIGYYKHMNINLSDLKLQKQSYVPPKINTNALSKDATTYELERFKKNALIIFNQENIDGHKTRLGTDKDFEALKITFENFGFEVVEHKDFTKDAVLKELDKFTEQDFTDYGCVAVAVMTHGSNDGLLRAKDEKYSEIEIINRFKVLNKPTLITKPKIIIIQACRGTKIVPGVPVFQSGKVSKDLDEEEDVVPYTLPVESDILVLHSSYAGSPAHRNELHGSWLIQELCSKINSLASTHDLESIITEVKRAVAIDKQHEVYNKKTLQMEINKQMPVVTSTLIRKLYLRKFEEEPQKLETFADKKRESFSYARSEVLDNCVPNTPLLVQFGPCSCFLEHFNYLRNCLKYFTEENPNDETALNFLEVAYTFEEGVEFNTAKEKMSKAISKHLLNNARGCENYKYLHFYKH